MLYDPELQHLISFESGGRTSIQKASSPPEGISCILRLALVFKCQVYVLDSIRSGLGLRTLQNGVYGRILKPIFDSLDIRHTYIATDSRHAIGDFALSLEDSGVPIMVIIAGGDTSVNEFVNSLNKDQKGEIYIATVPEGTGNALALSNGCGEEKEAVKCILLASVKRPLQLYLVEFPSGSEVLHHDGLKETLQGRLLFVVVASWAFHASLVADSDTDEMRKHGINRFKIAAENNLTRPQKYCGDVTIGNDRALQGPLAYFVVTPAQRFEPTFEILPRGNIHDSSLYVVAFQTEENDSYIMDIMGKVYAGGKHVDIPNVFYEEVKESENVILSLGANLPLSQRRFCVDGAIVVIPETKESAVEIKYHGHTNGSWDLYILS